ncbi:MAG: response regulator transcription factor [Alphaproteobacteria bacterium]|nr:response regulator transcription factor [Alphaproteobacteria bacterium]
MNKNILVVDDDKILRSTLATGLRRADFNVITAESASEAEKILERISTDAIVLDRMMDGMDGLTFLKQLRLNGNTTPVIMLTALSGSDNAIDGLSGGANDYMAKPFQLQELVLRLKNITKTPENHTRKNNYSLGLIFADGEFFIKTDDEKNKLLSLSSEEKKLLQNLISPVGNIVSATPMVAKRLRNKINGVLSDIDIITVRGMGYKIITKKH